MSHAIFHTQLCHTPSLTHHLRHTIFHTTLSHTIFHTRSQTIFHTPLCLTPSFTTSSFTHHFVTHHFHHTIFHIQLCRTPSFTTSSFTHNFVTHHLSPHHLSHTTLSHTIFRTQLCHALFFTPTFAHTIFHTQVCHTHTHHLSLSHTIFHIQLCHTHTTLLYFSILHHLLCLSFLPRPRYNIWCSLLEEVALWGYPAFNVIASPRPHIFARCFCHGLPHSQTRDTPRHICIPHVCCRGTIDCDGPLAQCGIFFLGRTVARSRGKI